MLILCIYGQFIVIFETISIMMLSRFSTDLSDYFIAGNTENIWWIYSPTFILILHTLIIEL